MTSPIRKAVLGMTEYEQKLQLLRIMQAYGKIEVALADYTVQDMTGMLYDGLAHGNWPKGFIKYAVQL